MIRLYEPRIDEAELVRLIRTELIPLSHTVHQHDAQTIRELPKRFRRGVTYVASLSKKSAPVAFIHFEVMGEVLYLDMMVTHPEHRNRQWGRKLIAHSEAYGQAQQCKVARLFVDQVNAKAHHLYNKLGYNTVRYLPELRCYELLKPLTPLSLPNV
ncbi:GNAT family N-acetyltransferase [Paenibacillus prosopidis]|uniref:Ribosomal protein S18 acetylase RimI-like enzyme n=1 Tax=Paenibacillus prosopidis TaxID=630520 RepID=A0A368VL00_9BACL|nr:GNAT family N-acetyltransferase [Paenibacillus prosopidis]RCW42164.1 ribosomal protein S18 acetylase RimI-like enzyme [Paenibacillus prosopidis]